MYEFRIADVGHAHRFDKQRVAFRILEEAVLDTLRNDEHLPGPEGDVFVSANFEGGVGSGQGCSE